MGKTYEVITKDGKHQHKYEVWRERNGLKSFCGVCFAESPKAHMELYGWNTNEYIYKLIPFSMWDIGDSKPVKSE